MSTTVDTTKNVAALAFDKGVSFVGSAKGIFILLKVLNNYNINIVVGNSCIFLLLFYFILS